MEPQTPPSTLQPQQSSSEQSQSNISQITEKQVPFYRSYWIFAAIYLILPPIIGLVILFTGDIYRKQKGGQVLPISNREKVTLTIVVFLLWGYAIFVR